MSANFHGLLTALLVKAGKHNAYDRILGEVFRQEREKRGLSQARLSEIAGIARTGLIVIERGERSPTVHICKALADALEIPLSRLIRRAEKLLAESEVK